MQERWKERKSEGDGLRWQQEEDKGIFLRETCLSSTCCCSDEINRVHENNITLVVISCRKMMQRRKIKQGCRRRCSLTSLSPIPPGLVIFDVGRCSKAISLHSYTATIIQWMDHLIALMFLKCRLKDAKCNINELKYQNCIRETLIWLR